MTDLEVPSVPYDEEEQQARCRKLELAVLIRAILDATWREADAAHWQNNPKRAADIRRMQLRRAEALAWWLDLSLRPHIESIAERAGLPDGWIWSLVKKFITESADPAPLRVLWDVMMYRPADQNLAFPVAFVA